MRCVCARPAKQALFSGHLGDFPRNIKGKLISEGR